MKSKKTYYPDDSFYVTVEEFTPEFVFRINNYEDLWELNQILDVYKHNGYAKPLVTIPCLLDAQADRRFQDNQPNSLKLVLNFLNDMHATFNVFHPHNAEVVESTLDNVKIIDNSVFISNVLTELHFNNKATETEGKLEDHLILMSSDAGGFKPLMKLCDKLTWKGETFSASKARKYTDGKSKLVQKIDREDFGGKDILIVDDICVKGGTFIGLAKMLKERNVGKLYLAVSHLTLETVSEDLINAFDKIYTTDSKGFEQYKMLNSNNSGHDRIYSVVAENIVVIQLFSDMICLKLLSQELDEALSRETPESLSKWLLHRRKKNNECDESLKNNQELFIEALKFIAKTNIEFEERDMPFEIKMDFRAGGTLLSLAKSI